MPKKISPLKIKEMVAKIQKHSIKNFKGWIVIRIPCDNCCAKKKIEDMPK